MLNAGDLMREAARRTGLDDFGTAPLADGLDVLCRAMSTQARLNAAGLKVAHEELLGLLAIRLQIEDWFRAHPETEDQQIVAPLMVTGLPRSGTTALSQMLSQDPANRSIRRWEAAQPVPPPAPPADASDPRLIEMQARLDQRYVLTPRLMAINPVMAGDPTESLCFLRMTLRSQHFGGFYNVPSYMEWLSTVDMTPSYAYLKRALKVLQFNYPGARWNLKYPLDLFWLPEIGEVFPDARLIWTHRDPVQAIPSALSLITAFREPYVEEPDPSILARGELDQRVEMVRRALDYRRTPGALPIVDIYNVDLVENAEATIQGTYERLGLPYSEAFDQRLRRRNHERPKGKFGAHSYTAAHFDLDEVDIANRFRFYTDAMAVPTQSKTLEAGFAGR